MHTRYLFLPGVLIALLLSAGNSAPVESRAPYRNNVIAQASPSTPDHPAVSRYHNTDPKRSDDGHQETEDDVTQLLQVELDITPRIEHGKLFFDVITNLPDGMLFLATIVDDMGIINSADTTLERVHVLIDAGRMTIGPFPARETPFPSGEYTLYLNSSPVIQQPPEVISVVGENGEKLSGQYVTKGAIIFIKTFMVTGAARSR